MDFGSRRQAAAAHSPTSYTHGRHTLLTHTHTLAHTNSSVFFFVTPAPRTIECSYLRVKRKNQTYCFLCEDTDTILDVKRRVHAAVSQHAEHEDSSGDDGPSSAESLQLLLPAETEQQPQQGSEDNADDDGDDEEMMDDDDDDNRKKLSSFLKDDDTLGNVRGKASMKEEEAELVLHVVFPVADNEWEPVEVVPTAIQDS
jgi:hypothetical protein